MPSDDFNRPDSNSLGDDWAVIEFAAAQIRVEGNALVCENPPLTWAFAYWFAWAGSDDHGSQLKFVSSVFVEDMLVGGPAVRLAVGALGPVGYSLEAEPGRLAYLVVKWSSDGNGYVLGSFESSPLVDGDVLALLVEGAATPSLRAVRNGQVIGTVVDDGTVGGAVVATGKPGFLMVTVLAV